MDEGGGLARSRRAGRRRRPNGRNRRPAVVAGVAALGVAGLVAAGVILSGGSADPAAGHAGGTVPIGQDSTGKDRAGRTLAERIAAGEGGGPGVEGATVSQDGAEQAPDEPSALEHSSPPSAAPKPDAVRTAPRPDSVRAAPKPGAARKVAGSSAAAPEPEPVQAAPKPRAVRASPNYTDRKASAYFTKRWGGNDAVARRLTDIRTVGGYLRIYTDLPESAGNSSAALTLCQRGLEYLRGEGVLDPVVFVQAELGENGNPVLANILGLTDRTCQVTYTEPD